MAENENLAGLYAANRKRSTVRPSAEPMAEAFQQITRTVIPNR